MSTPDYPYGRIVSQPDPAPTLTPDNGGYVSVADLDRIIAEKLAERDKQHEEEMAAVRARLPQLLVAANAGGPGNDNHQTSWSLAEQEVAARGERLDHWT